MLSCLFMLLAFVASSTQAPPPLLLQTPKRYDNSSRATRPLTFNKDGTFQICIFNDLHFGESEYLLAGPVPSAPSKSEG